MAVNLSKMKAIRDAFHRTPCAPDSDRYLQFEKSFTFDPTEDQKSCFQVSNFIYAIFCSIYIPLVLLFSFFYCFCYFGITITSHHYNTSHPFIIEDNRIRYDKQHTPHGSLSLRWCGLRQDRGRHPGHLQSCTVQKTSTFIIFKIHLMLLYKLFVCGNWLCALRGGSHTKVYFSRSNNSCLPPSHTNRYIHSVDYIHQILILRHVGNTNVAPVNVKTL